MAKKIIAIIANQGQLLSDHQYGFRRARSTGDLLADAVHGWSSALEACGESRMIPLDIFLAFDPFCRKCLLSKLPMFGLYHTLIKWIGIFLSDMSIDVRVDGFLSNLHSINAGVPQGSVISPVLFILLMNDLLTSTSSNIHSFADDTFLSSSFSFNPNDHASSATHSHPFQVSLLTSRTLSHKSSFIPRTCNLWNVLPSSCFPESYNLPSFQSKINKRDLISLSS